MKPFLWTLALAMILLFSVSCDNSNTPITVSEASKEVASSSVQTTNNGTEQEIMLIGDAKFAAGCESWKKGDQVSFEVTSNNSFEAEVGIIAVLSDGDYGKIYSETIIISPKSKIVVIEVPDDGDYGIYYKNNNSKEAVFNAKLNKELQNPLI